MCTGSCGPVPPEKDDERLSRAAFSAAIAFWAASLFACSSCCSTDESCTVCAAVTPPNRRCVGAVERAELAVTKLAVVVTTPIDNPVDRGAGGAGAPPAGPPLTLPLLDEDEMFDDDDDELAVDEASAVDDDDDAVPSSCGGCAGSSMRADAICLSPSSV